MILKKVSTYQIACANYLTKESGTRVIKFGEIVVQPQLITPITTKVEEVHPQI
jgi:hypothetical protein